MRVKEAVEEHLFCGALVDNSPRQCCSKRIHDNLEKELGPELSALSSKQKNPPPLCSQTRRSKVDNVSNLFFSYVECIQASEKQSQDLERFLMKELVQSFATTMDAMQLP